jgi:hypothetical protein
MSEYITETININDVINENKILKDKLDTIMKENKQLKRNIQNLQDLMGCVICEYFNDWFSLKKTTELFYFDNVSDCYHALVEYYGASDPAESAIDYKECYKDIFGRTYEEDHDMDEDDTLLP